VLLQVHVSIDSIKNHIYTSATAADHKAEQRSRIGIEMRTAINSRTAECERQSGASLWGVLAQTDHERIPPISRVERTHRHLNDNPGRELEETVGIPPVFFDVLSCVAAACGAGRR
jgi:hypothetical protein